MEKLAAFWDMVQRRQEPVEDIEQVDPEDAVRFLAEFRPATDQIIEMDEELEQTVATASAEFE